MRDGAASRPQRVLIVYDGVPPWRKGGAETRLGAIAQGLAARGWKVDWLGLVGDDGAAGQMTGGVRVTGVGREPPPRSTPRRGLWRTARFLWGLYRADWPEADVVLLGQTPWLHYFIARWRTPHHVPIIVDCWEVWGEFWRSYYGGAIGVAGRAIERAILRRADMIACISPQTRAAALEQGADPARLRDLPNGVALNDIGTGPTVRRFGEIVYWGRLVPHKNVHLLIEAFALLTSDHPDARLTILGGGSEQDRLVGLAYALGVAGRVEFTGTVEDARTAFARMREGWISVQPSTSEGGGSIAVHEAHACGLPVVAFRHPQGIDPALIDEGITGYWLDRVDAATLAGKLAELFTDPARVDAQRPACLAAAASLDWPVIAERYEDALLDAIASKRR